MKVNLHIFWINIHYPIRGALGILGHIKSQNGINIVVSHSRQDKLGYCLDHVGLAHMIDRYHGVDDGRIASSEDALKRKTKIIKEIINEHDGSSIYAVGDADTDFHAAEAAGVDLFFWLLPANNKWRKQQLYKHASPDKLRFILGSEEIALEL